MKTYKEVVRRYYKYIYEAWTQPVLSSNGTMGGDSFATSASDTDSRTQPYFAFDSNSSDTYTAGWLSKASNNYLQWYNAEPLNITKLRIQYQTTSASGVGYINNWKLQASNDNSTYIDILSGTTGNYGITTIPVEHINSYKYWRFYPISWSSEWYAIIDLKITATKQVIVESTQDDYDFYEDVDVYKAPQAKSSSTYYMSN